MKDWDVSEIRRALAPSGGLRTTINCGNPILARHEQTTREVSGMSVDLARKLAEEISVPLDLVVVESAGKAVAAVERGDADVGFFARDPDRAGLIAFTEPYVLIEGCYLVREGASISTIDQVDETGNRIMVGEGSAYDLFLSRHIVHATVERVPTSPAVVQAFLDAGADVAAGARQQLEKDAASIGGPRIIPGRFMVIEQAMGVARRQGTIAEAFLAAFVKRLKLDEFVERALKRHRVEGVTVAQSPAFK